MSMQRSTRVPNPRNGGLVRLLVAKMIIPVMASAPLSAVEVTYGQSAPNTGQFSPAIAQPFSVAGQRYSIPVNRPPASHGCPPSPDNCPSSADNRPRFPDGPPQSADNGPDLRTTVPRRGQLSGNGFRLSGIRFRWMPKSIQGSEHEIG